MMHVDLVGVLVSILKDVGIPDMAVVIEVKGLRAADASRPGDVVFMDHFAEGRHLVIDAVVMTVYRNTILRSASIVPGYAAKQAEDRKFQAGRASSQPIVAIHGPPHLGPICDGGRRSTGRSRSSLIAVFGRHGTR